MEPRLRAGLVAGSATAIAMVVLCLTGLGVCGPFLAVLGGISTAFQTLRDPRNARNYVSASAIAGLYAGALTAIAQFIGLLLFLTTQSGKDLNNQLAHINMVYTPNLVALVIGIIGFLLGLVDTGIMVGIAILIAHYLARRLSLPSSSPARIPFARPPAYPSPRPIPPPARPLAAPPTSTIYPPPPSFYGLPDVTSEQNPPQERRDPPNSADRA